MPPADSQKKRILFHAPGLAAFRPAAGLPHLLGTQPTVAQSMRGLLPTHQLTGNRGNMIHAEAPARLFLRDREGSAYGNLARLHKSLGDRYAERIAENFDVIILSMANFLRPKQDVGSLGEALKALDGKVPFIVLGAGLQGRHKLSDLKPGTIDTIAIFNEQAAVFGVRGTETRDWLHKNGFTRAEVLGCPSLYVYPQSIMQMDSAPARAKGNAARVITAGHLSIRANAIVRRGLELAAALKGVEASYVMQDEFLDYGDIVKQANLYNDGNSQIDAGVLNAWFADRFKIDVNFARYYYFNESGAWRQASLNHDVYIGDRFHCGVAALQAGVPAIFLKEDNRVGELTDYFGLPALSIKRFQQYGLKKTMDRMLDDEKIAQMKQRYANRFGHFRQTMAKQGLEIVTRLPK